MSRRIGRPGTGPRLHRHESIRDGLRRVLLAGLDQACLAMADEEESAAEQVHRARVALKRTRAVLRLIEACDVDWARDTRRRMARLAREFSRMRDAAVLGEARRKLGLAAPVADADSGGSWPDWQEEAKAERQQLARRHWPVLHRADCLKALAESAARLRRREEIARNEPGARRLHDWRKGVIVLREQLNVLREILTPRQRGYAGKLHPVARKLGAARDLTLLLAVEKSGHATIARQVRVERVREARRKKVKAAHRLAEGLADALCAEFGPKRGAKSTRSRS
jgi:CHAD domain-containing protein